MDINSICELVYSASQVISILACILLLCKYVKFSSKPTALKMISLLTIANIIFHTIALSISFLPESFTNSVIPPIIVNTSMRFSIFWASSLAFLLFKSPTRNEFDAKKYYSRSFLASFIISLDLSIL